MLYLIMKMDELEQQLHRTWVQYLISQDFNSIAIIAIDVSLSIFYEYNSLNNVHVSSRIMLDVPIDSLKFFQDNWKTIRETLTYICKGHIFDSDQNQIHIHIEAISYRVALLEVEEGWKNIVRRMIINSNEPNQGIITDKAFSKRGQNSLLYNEMKFASKSEIRIAQELESKKILFFPLPLAVRHETGNFYNDHREVDFLICHDGVWGILEIAGNTHTGRYEKDKEKDAWFKKSGILCIEHYTAENCNNNPKKVVEEFMSILARYK